MWKNELFQLLFACLGVIVVSEEVVYTIKHNISLGELDSVINQLTQNGRKEGVITNEADDKLMIWCSSFDGDKWEGNIHPGQSMAFSFRTTIFMGIDVDIECTMSYKGFWAQWYVYNKYAKHINIDNNVYHYIVRSEGIYINGKKICCLASGKYRYVLWEHYKAYDKDVKIWSNDRKPYGRSLTGYVDSEICNNIPDWMSDKVSAITLCENHCVIVYQMHNCGGPRDTFRAYGRCNNVHLYTFNDNVRSIKGC